MAEYTEITCETACHKLKRKIPYGWDLNIYRGCEHGCAYCYAMGMNRRNTDGPFDQDIQVKTNVLERLERELTSPHWQREVVNLGGVTDSYQPAEAKYKLMPDIWRLLIKTRTPCILSTKSDLVLRDFDLIAALARVTYVNIAATVTCMDEAVRQKLEPKAAPSQARFEMLRAFADTDACTGLHCMPIIPYLTDGEENLDALYSRAAWARVDYALPGTLYLRGTTRPAFFAFIQKEFPALYEPLTALYKTGGAGKAYKDGLYQKIDRLKAQYGVSSGYMAPMKKKLAAAAAAEPVQTSLFE